MKHIGTELSFAHFFIPTIEIKKESRHLCYGLANSPIQVITKILGYLEISILVKIEIPHPIPSKKF